MLLASGTGGTRSGAAGGEADSNPRGPTGSRVAEQVWAELGRLEPGVPWVRGGSDPERAFATAERRRRRHRVYLRTLGPGDAGGLDELVEAAVREAAGAAPGERHTHLVVVDDPVDSAALRARVERFNRENWTCTEEAESRVRLAVLERAWGVVVAPGALEGLPSLARMRLPTARHGRAA